MNKTKITSEDELEKAKKRINSIQSDIEDHEDEISGLNRELEDLECAIDDYNDYSELPDSDHPVMKLLALCRDHWERFTGREARIIEAAACKEGLSCEQKLRLKHIALRELGSPEI